MLSVLCLFHSLRFVVPEVMMLGVAPQYLTMWLTWRLVSSVFSRRTFERGDEIMYDMYQSLICFFFETYTGAEVILYGDKIPWDKKENIILMCNHQCTVDWIVADLLAIRQGSLGNIRYILKNGLRYLPLYGFYFGQHSCIYVRRGGNEDQDELERKLEHFKQHKTPMWLVIFPEGTRYTLDKPEVIQKSKEYARQHGLQELQHVLTPKTKATETSIDKLHDYIDAVYDLTIAYKGVDEDVLPRMPAKSMPAFLESRGQQIHIYCHRYEPKDIPRESEKRKQWLYNCFSKKDKILGRFYKEKGGTFPGVPRRKRLPWYRTTPYFLFWLAILAPFVGTKVGRSAYWKMWLLSSIGTIAYMAVRK